MSRHSSFNREPGELLALAERCEAATGPDRALDRIISLTSNDRDERARINPPRYTASLDAAMTLVPEGWHWQIGVFNLDGKGRAQLAQQVETEFGTAIGVRQQATASTAALALCAAALKARATQ